MSRLKMPLIVGAVLACGSLVAARHDGLIVHLTFDDERFPLQNLAPGGKGIEATVIGDAIAPTYVAGKFGRAAKFQAGSTAGLPKLTRDWAISLGRISSFYEGNFTVACWLNPTARNPGMIFTNKPSNGIAAGWGFSAGVNRSFLLNPVGAAGYSSGAGLEIGTWTHLAMVVDRSAGKVKFYVDGILRGDSALPSTNASLGDEVPTVVGAAGTGEFGSDVLVDEVAIWKRALTDIEIASIGGEGKRIPEPSAYVWAGLGAAGLAAVVARRRRRV